MIQRYLLLGLAAILLASCAPAAERPAPRYFAGAEAMLAAIKEIAATLRPDAFSPYLELVEEGRNRLTFRSVTGEGLLFRDPIVTTVNARVVAAAETVRVEVTGSGPGAIRIIDKLINQLDQRFRRVME
jgi:hypothetical protein